MALTDKSCKSAKPLNRIYKLSDANGLYLEIWPNGRKYWRLKYRFRGKEKRLAFGIYPEVTLLSARKKREEARKLLADGIDPNAAKKEKERLQALNDKTTFEAVSREWHTLNHEQWDKIYSRNILHHLEVDMFPVIGGIPIANIKPLQILDALRLIEKRGAGEVARRALQYTSQVFRYAIITERAERNPATDLKGALKPMRHSHFASIEPDDIPAFLQAIYKNEARLYAQTRNAVLLLMLTFVRTSELVEASWNEFNLDNAEWIIPAERMKTRKQHMVPLSKQSLNILREQQKLTGQWKWIFPNQAHHQRHMSNNTILGAIRRIGYKGRMTGHGFRALAMSTIKEKLGYRHEVVDRQLAHAPANKVDAAYDRAKFLPDRRRMMQEWADYLDKVADQHKVINVDFSRAAE